MSALNVYLDTSHWHALAAAANGAPRNPGDTEVLALLGKLVGQEVIRIPLSCFNYFELAEFSSDKGRERAGRLMGELSRFWTMAPLHVVMQGELESSLHARFGRPERPTPVPKFGFGAGFAMGRPLTLRLEGGTPEQRTLLEARTGVTIAQLVARLQVQSEFALLIGPPRADWDKLPGYDALAGRELENQELQSIQVMIGNLLGEAQLASRPRDAILARQFMADLRPILAPTMAKAGFGIGDWPFGGKEDLEAFLLSMPSRRVAVTMQSHYIHKGKDPWEVGDLRDIDALSLALPICDIVVVDKEVFDAATIEHLDTLFEKKFLRHLVDLASYLRQLDLVTSAGASHADPDTAYAPDL